jgi:hypothetical protein
LAQISVSGLEGRKTQRVGSRFFVPLHKTGLFQREENSVSGASIKTNMPGKFAHLEVGFAPGKAFQDMASPDDGVDRISFPGVGDYFTITTIDSLLHRLIFRLQIFVNKYFS